MLNKLDVNITPKVLIIDDDRLFNGALARAIKKMGYDVESRFCLLEGYEEAISNPYDAIYLDVRLPDGNGLEALPKFCKVPSSPEIIVVTGFAYSNGAERAYANGAWWYIRKPASMKEYTLPLIRVLEHRGIKPQAECAAIRTYRTTIGDSELITIMRLIHKYVDLYLIAEKSGCTQLCATCVQRISEKCDQVLGKNIIFPKPFQRPQVIPHPFRRKSDFVDDRPVGKILIFPK